ncbi:hypothetical protein JCM11251_005427 [Rhodosporidiobolus azoricus]
MDSPALALRRGQDDLPLGRHRASSDPLSRGGAFLDGSGLLAHEPNPFEQSFRPGFPPLGPTDGTASSHGGAGRRARSTSPTSLMPRATPGGSAGSGGGGQKLPPLSLMQTPGTELSAFGWGVDSLRTGPLSPALLNGPTGTSGASDHDAFDPSSFRTGLTPLVAGAAGSGGAASGAGVSFPPPSPATAALFAMMTNNTPGTSDAAAAAAAGVAGGGPRPHEGPNEGNQFEASFAQVANGGGVPALNSANSLHRSAMANNNQMANGVSTRSSNAMGSGAGYFPPQPPPPQNGQPNSYHFLPGSAPPPHQPQQAHHPHSRAPAPVHAYSSAAPPTNLTVPAPPTSLDLLTQASSYQSDDALVAAAALSGLATPGGGFPAAAVLAASNQAQQQGAGVMPGSTVTGGAGANGVAVKQPSPTPSASSPSAPTTASGRAKRAASQANVAVLANGGGGSATGKRARKATAAAQEMDEQNALLDEEQAAKKGPATKRSKRGAASRNNSKADFTDDGYGDEDSKMFDDEGMYGGGAGSAAGGQAGGASGGAKGGRGRKKDTGETEEEKRKNFLERNRQAALKCRQRKKAWLQSLQTKVELLTTDNDQLQSTVNNLREEVNSLRAILAAHANCPVAMGGGGPPPGVAVGVSVPPLQPGMVPGPPGHHPHEMHMVQHQGRRPSLPGGVPTGYGQPPQPQGVRY